MADNLSFSWELKGQVEEQIKAASKDAEHLREVIQKLNVDLTKITLDDVEKNIANNVKVAERALYKLFETKEKVDKALSRNMSLRQEGLFGMDESKLLQASARIDDIINKVMNIGAEANFSKNAVRDLLALLSSDIAIKDAKNAASIMDKGLDKQVRENAKAQKDAAKEIAAAFEDADKAAKNNAKNQELVKDALAKIATARANLSAASENASIQDQTHARLLMSLLDQLAKKLNVLKGEFLGERGMLDGVLGSGYKGLMRNVGTAIHNITKMSIGGMGDDEWNREKALAAQLERRQQIISAVKEQAAEQERAAQQEAAAVNRVNELLQTRQHKLEIELRKNAELNAERQRQLSIQGDSAAWHTTNQELNARIAREKELAQLRDAIINRHEQEAAAVNKVNEILQMRQHRLEIEQKKNAELNAEKQRQLTIQGESAAWHTQNQELNARMAREKELAELRDAIIKRHEQEADAVNRVNELLEIRQHRLEMEQKKNAEIYAEKQRQLAIQGESAAWHTSNQETAANIAREKELLKLRDAIIKRHEQEAAVQERATQRQNASNQARQQQTQKIRQQAEELVKLRMELLKTQAAELQGVLKRGRGILDAGQYQEVQNALRTIREEMRQLESVMQRIGTYSIRDLFGFGRGTSQNYSPLASYANEAIQASHAVNMLTASERQFIESLSQSSSWLSKHGVLLSDLRMMATQYLSLWGARNYINNIIETGGLLEQQRLSIGAILGSMDKAEVVFGKIKDLAVKSPFGVVELDKMSKQLTAYGFKYEELFDWTKRLADISAATGTEVSRLALALGHVRAEGALSGYTLRQFAMANVPMLQNLANNLGITTKQVREKTKKKEISYDDVMKVMKDLTDEGGMFYNAQEVMSQALNAKFKNLRDAFDIMYGEIAESGVGDVLKGIAETLTAGAKEWRRFGTDILWVASAFGIAKLASVAYTAGMATMRKELGVLALNTRAFTAEEVKQMVVNRQITREQLLRSVATGKLTVEQAKLAASTFGVSEAELRQVATTKTVSAALLGNAIATSKLTVAELRYIATLRASLGIGAKYRNFQIALAMGFKGIENAVRAAGAAMRSFLPFLAIGAAVDIFSRWSQQKEAAKEMAQSSASSMFTGAENIKSLYDSLKKNGREDVTGSVERMKEALKEVGAYVGQTKEQVEATKDLNAQYDILIGKLGDISKKYIEAKAEVEKYMELANRIGGSIFTDNMGKDLKQWGDANIEAKVAKKMADKYSDIYTKELVKKLKEDGKWVEKEMKDMDWSELLGKIDDTFAFAVGLERLPSIFNNSETSIEKDRYNDSAITLRKYIDALYELDEARKEVESHMPKYSEYVKASADTSVKTYGLDVKDMKEWSQEEFNTYFNRGLKAAVETLNIPEETKKELLTKVIESFDDESIRAKLLISFEMSEKDDKEKELEKWQEDLNKYFKDHNINIVLGTDDNSIQKVEKKLQDFKKSAQEKIDANGPVLVSVGLDLSKLPKSFDQIKNRIPAWQWNFVEKAFKEYGEGIEEKEKADQTHKDTGLTVDDPKKNKNKGTKTDKALEKAKTELDEIKKIYAEYKKYRDVFGSEKAQSMIEEIFGIDRKRSDEIIKNYKVTIRKIIDSLPASSDARKKFKTGGEQLLGDIKLDDTKQQFDFALKELQEYISKRTSNWNLYKQLLEKTGDNEFAKNAFVDNRVWDDAARELEKKLLEKTGDVAVDYTMTQAAAEKYYKDNKEAYELWKKIVELTTHNWTDGLTKGADAYAQLLTVSEKIKKNEEEIARLRQEGAGVPGNEVRIMGLQKENEKLAWEQFQQGSDYLNLFGAVLTMTNDEVEKTAQTIKQRLAVELSRGIITAHQYSKSIKEVNDQLTKSRTAIKGVKGQFMTGGQNAVVNYREGEMQAAAFRVEEAQKELDLLNKRVAAGEEVSAEELFAANAKVDNAKTELDATEKALANSRQYLATLQNISNIIGIVSGALDGMKQAATSLYEMFDALGNESAANDFSDIADTIGAVSSIISPVDGIVKNLMSGNISGIVSSAIASPIQMVTGPITAFAKLHDKQVQREIDASKGRQEEMENLTKNLESLLERTLGGVYTLKADAEDINKLREARKKANTTGHRTADALLGIGYYTEETGKTIDKAVESESYYDTKLAELMIQRDELTRQMNAEEDKKKTDHEAVENYKQQIKELQDEIENFAIDMAKALYDIDVKSWAIELGDALYEAWKKGEDGAEAFKKKATELIGQVAKKIVSMQIIETAMEPVQKVISDMMIDTNGKLNPEDMADKVAGALENSLNMIGNTYDTTMDAVDAALEKHGFPSMKDTDSSSSSSSSIKGVTEQTADLLASYINAIRADVSVNRVTLQQILYAVQTQTEMPVIARAQLTQLQQIAGNTRRNADVAADIYNLLHRVENGAARWYVN